MPGLLIPKEEGPKFSDGATRYLCVVRGEGESRERGFLIEGSWAVNLGYVWDGGDGNEIHYDSPEAVAADGWGVD